ncbi:MAG: tRNA (adenosine(37)-N6)-threonylcarbamoyltransferase complex transferase subunit TsaD [Bacteroidales bacterium]|jgi:N6-L-threonylcarbamoyladenine synthase|nr:tRNA (adenosine(37)-N6)-threonylcarbamoyltransferase complex transferase subunit TsaD [Bacteroidales bacterium]
MNTNPYYILAIESSCDDTSAAVIRSDFHILSNSVASQNVHSAYGGVVPELASRAHQSNIIPVIDDALRKSGIDKSHLSAVAFTCGPGLLGSLLVGVSFAKAFALSLNLPLISVNHLEAHVLAHFIKDTNDAAVPRFPFLCLLVSGGNTQIILVENASNFTVIGSTLDDAAGETLDKTAKLLSLPYPGGPQIERLAKEGDPNSFRFSTSHVGGFDYSFSGLKTSILYKMRDELKKNPQFIEENRANIAASVQKAVVDSLIHKFSKAVTQVRKDHPNLTDIAIAGGVSANSLLKSEILRLGKEQNLRTFLPNLQYSTDNAAMVAAASLFKYEKTEFANLNTVPFTR